MAGIEKITDQILKKAENEKEALLSEARKEVLKITEDAENEIRALTEESKRKTEEKLKDLTERRDSAVQQQNKRTMLKARQEVITGLLEDAKKSIAEADSAEYFGMLLKLLSANVQKNDGEIRFSGEDLKRLPEGFEEKIRKIAEEKGGSLTISEKSADIRDGFLLVYGLVEENCSLDAVFSAAKDDLTDLVNSML